MLTEAIVRGRSGSRQSTELITDIRTVFQGEWRDDPRLSCHSGQQQLENDSGQEQAAGFVSVKTRLVAAEGSDEC